MKYVTVLIQKETVTMYYQYREKNRVYLKLLFSIYNFSSPVNRYPYRSSWVSLCTMVLTPTADFSWNTRPALTDSTMAGVPPSSFISASWR